ncbi:MAG: hypothetical protein HOC70_14735 [Gammaproteobacteria bacterium]|nr:hypothetical protein [Gammaproteobacteria bacterium]
MERCFMPSHRTSFERFTELQVLSFPFRLGNLLLLTITGAIYSYLYLIWTSLGTIGFVLTTVITYLTTLLYVSYLVFVADYTTLGYQYLPKLSMNVIDSSRWKILKAMVLLSFFASLVPLVDSQNWRAAVFVFCAVVLPLATAVLLVENSLFKALMPTTWLTMLRTIELDGFLFRVLGAEFLLILVIYLVLNQVTGVPGIYATLLLAMVLFRSLGALLHRNADHLGIIVLYGPQAEAANQAESHRRDIAGELRVLQQLCESGGTVKAFRRLEARLARDHYKSESEFFKHLRAWSNPDLAVLVGRGYVERLVQHRQFSDAIEVLGFCYGASGGDFVLHKTSSLLKLTEFVSAGEEKRMLARLLSEVPDRFSRDPNAGDALVLAAKLFAEELVFETASSLLERIEQEYPIWIQNADYRRISDLVRQGE